MRDDRDFKKQMCAVGWRTRSDPCALGAPWTAPDSSPSETSAVMHARAYTMDFKKGPIDQADPAPPSF